MRLNRLLGIVMLQSLFAFTIVSQIPTTGLVGAWTFSGNANDVSTGANHGTVNGATLTTDRFGNCDAAYSFNGTNNYIIMPTGGPIGNASRSLSFWAKTTNTLIQTAFGYGVSNANGGLYQVLFNHSCQGVGFDNSAAAVILKKSTTFADNAWHHYAAIFDNTVGTNIGSVQIYADGVLVNTVSCVVGSSVSPIQTINGLPITIGKDPNAAGRYFSGKLDDFYFYNRVLTVAEIQALFTATSSVSTTLSVSGNTLLCNGSSATYSTDPVPGAASYTWSYPSGWSGNSTNNSVLAHSGSNSGTISVVATTTCGSTLSGSLNVTVSPCTDLKKSTQTKIVLELSPVPASSFLILEASQEIAAAWEITIYDLTGKTVLKNTMSRQRTTVDISSLPSGIYVLHAAGDRVNFNKKFVKD